MDTGKNRNTRTVSTKELVTALLEKGCSYQRRIQGQDRDREDGFRHGFEAGWLEAQDSYWMDRPLERHRAARILHMYLKLECGEPDLENWDRARELKDLYDCHTCVIHIGQIYARHMMDAYTGVDKSGRPYLYFDGKRTVSESELSELLQRVFEIGSRETVAKKRNPDISFGEKVDAYYVTDAMMQDWIHDGKYPMLIDVRSEREFAEKHENTAISVPLAKILNDPECIDADRNRLLVFTCETGYQSHMAVNCLRDHGYQKVYWKNQMDSFVAL